VTKPAELDTVMSREASHRGSSRSSRSSSLSPRFVSPYAFTKTGITGEQRESMLQSELQTIVCQSRNKFFSIFFLV